MSYESNTWSTGDVISAEKLNKIEKGIENGDNSVLARVAFTGDYNDLLNKLVWIETEMETLIDGDDVALLGSPEADERFDGWYIGFADGLNASVNEGEIVDIKIDDALYEGLNVAYDDDEHMYFAGYTTEEAQSSESIDNLSYPFRLQYSSQHSNLSLIFYTRDSEKTSVRIELSGGMQTIHKLPSKYVDGKFIVSGAADGSEIFNDTENNVASGYRSHAEGHSTTASGTAAHAEGIETSAGGDNAYGSHAEGYNAVASGSYSHAEGSGTTASGSASHAEGSSAKATSDNAHAEGAGTTASGSASHAEGAGTTASGPNAHSEGAGTTASQNGSHAEGVNSAASGTISHAEGYNTTASGTYAHAEGSGTAAAGQSSHAEGTGSTTYATADSAHAEGRYTKASSSYQHVQGKFNVEDTNGTYAHIVGGGTSDNARANIHTLDWNGNAYYKGSLTLDNVTITPQQLSSLLALLNT